MLQVRGAGAEAAEHRIRQTEFILIGIPKVKTKNQ
jgi:hypothetical protein